MKTLLLSILAATVLAVPSGAAADVVTDIVDPYLRIQTALANDSMAPIKADAARIAAEAAKQGETAKALATTAAELQSSSTIEAARSVFGRLSDALIKYAEGAKSSLGSDLNVAYCPMEKKSWIQKGKAILNPYGGKKMQSCGEIVKAVK
jgi:hypothetical protein